MGIVVMTNSSMFFTDRLFDLQLKYLSSAKRRTAADEARNKWQANNV